MNLVCISLALLCTLPALVNGAAFTYLPYRCYLTGVTCAGTCSNTDGFCTACTALSDGVDGSADCTVPDPVVTPCTRTPASCDNGGTCSGGDCYCTDGFTKDTDGDCKISRASIVSCSGGNVDLGVIPHGDFSAGEIFYKGQNTDCKFEKDGDVWKIKASKLGVAPCISTNVPADGTNTIVVVVRYNSGVITADDIEITAICKTIKDGETEEKIVNFEANDAGFDTLSTDLTANGLAAVVNDAAGDLLAAPVDLGTSITIVLELEGGSAFSTIRLQSFEADIVDTFASTKLFVDVECKKQPNANSIGLSVIQVTDGKVTVTFNAFSLPGGAAGPIPIYIKLIVKLCTTAGDTGNCVAETCTAKRRRRQVTSDDAPEDEVQMKFLVIDPNNRNTAVDFPVIQEQSCLANVAFLLPLVVLVVICLMSMAAAMFFCLKLNQRSRNDPERCNGVTGPYKG